MNCVDVCPKGLNPTKAIGKIKELMVRRASDGPLAAAPHRSPGVMPDRASALDERSLSR
jgi:heterodisulfide reductase subunit C